MHHAPLWPVGHLHTATHAQAARAGSWGGMGPRSWACLDRAFTVVERSEPQFWSLGSLFGGGQNAVTVDREALRKGLKLKLGAAIELNQGATSRRVVESYLEELVGISGKKKGSVEGTWRLVWSSQTSESNPLAKPSEVLGGR